MKKKLVKMKRITIMGLAKNENNFLKEIEKLAKEFKVEIKGE
jgi:catalase